MLNQIYVLDEAKIPRLELEALKGSGEAALRLSNFYSMITLEEDKADYWMTIAAENGSVLGMYNLGQSLRSTYELQDTTRARYWFERVVESGQQPLASDAEKHIKDIDAEWIFPTK